MKEVTVVLSVEMSNQAVLQRKKAISYSLRNVL